jgi:3-oxoacyl-[acyl-carrier protein] reductase
VRGEEEAKKTVAAIEAKGGKAEAVGFDVRDMKATEDAIADIAKRHGRLDVVVANAGIAHRRPALAPERGGLDRRSSRST